VSLLFTTTSTNGGTIMHCPSGELTALCFKFLLLNGPVLADGPYDVKV
jgi:hypothetical protein